MGLLSKNLTSDTNVEELTSTASDVDIIVTVLTAVTSLFVMSCVALFIYYHWRVCRYIVETRVGSRQNYFSYSYYSKRS